MLATDIATQTAPSTARGSRGRIAIVAADGPIQSIAASVRELALEIVVFDSVQEMIDEPDGLEFSAIVLWVQDTVSAPTGLIAPAARRFAQTPIVLACADIERWEVRAALTAGASGVVLAEHLDGTMRPCLEAVQSGQTCVPRGHWRQIEPPALSSREKQILSLLVMGYMNGQIAAKLFLAESTVKSHLSSAFGKLGVRSRNEAVSLILDPQRGLGMGILTLGEE